MNERGATFTFIILHFTFYILRLKYPNTKNAHVKRMSIISFLIY